MQPYIFKVLEAKKYQVHLISGCRLTGRLCVMIWEKYWSNIRNSFFFYFKVEDKGQALTFHYRNVASENRQLMIEKAEQKIIDAGFMVGLADCAIECKPTVTFFYKFQRE